MRRLPRARLVGSLARFVRKKVVTSTFAYDNNGNLTQQTTDGITTTYLWDYANRLVALGVGGATTTYGYDAFGQRVLQTGTSTTTIYPFRWYSVASSTGAGAQFATTTEYIFNNDSLVSTVDQQFASGVATRTAQTRYIHPDHLGSTNVVTNASGTVVQTLDYYPYGATRVSGGVDASARKYIGEFADQTNLSYLNARYMEPSRGQFLTQDPAVVAADPSLLSDPQQLNTYSYARGNPLTLRDRDGKKVELVTRPVPFGSHAFILITNTAAAASNLQGLPSSVQNPTRITLGGYTDNVVNGDLYKDINHSTDFNLSPSSYIERTEIVAPQQYKGNQSAFENSIIQSYNDLPSVLGHYSVFGVPGFAGVGNSNNVATSILRGAGVDSSVIRGYRPLSLYSAQTPGLGTAHRYHHRIRVLGAAAHPEVVRHFSLGS
jgi:RHS repeat-associated protein